MTIYTMSPFHCTFRLVRLIVLGEFWFEIEVDTLGIIQAKLKFQLKLICAVTKTKHKN